MCLQRFTELAQSNSRFLVARAVPMAADDVEEIAPTHHGMAGHEQQSAEEHGGEVLTVKKHVFGICPFQ